MLFYYTNPTSLINGWNLTVEISNKELTPVVFYQNKVVGWGWLFVDDNIKRYEVDIK